MVALMPVTDLMTTAEVAERLGVTVKTVARMAEDGRLPYELKLPGLRGPYLFQRGEVERAAGEQGKAKAS